MLNSRNLVVAVLAVATIGLWLLWMRPDPARAVAAMGAAPADSIAGSETTATAGKTTVSLRPIPMAPLPSPDVPLAEVFDALRARADSGDAHAACRLAVSLLDCSSLAGLPSSAQYQQEMQVEHEHGVDAANFIAKQHLGMLASQQLCAGVIDAQKALAPHYLRQAARAGINEALVRYGDGLGFPPDGPYRMLRDPAFDTWRREAPAMMQRALQQGEPAAVSILYVAYTGDLSFFAGLVPDDRMRGAAFRLLMSRLRGRPQVQHPELTADEFRIADADSLRMHREYFNGGLIPEDASFAAAVSPRWVNNNNQGSPRASCQ